MAPIFYLFLPNHFQVGRVAKLGEVDGWKVNVKAARLIYYCLAALFGKSKELLYTQLFRLSINRMIRLDQDNLRRRSSTSYISGLLAIVSCQHLRMMFFTSGLTYSGSFGRKF